MWRGVAKRTHSQFYQAWAGMQGWLSSSHCHRIALSILIIIRVLELEAPLESILCKSLIRKLRARKGQQLFQSHTKSQRHVS